MKISILVLVSLTLAGSASAAGRFHCRSFTGVSHQHNLSLDGKYDRLGNLKDVEFGMHPNWDSGDYEDQPETVTLGSVRPDEDLRLTTPEWRNAYAYDVTTYEYGLATLYLQAHDMANKGVGVARLKFSGRGGKKNILLRCYY